MFRYFDSLDTQFQGRTGKHVLKVKWKGTVAVWSLSCQTLENILEIYSKFDLKTFFFFKLPGSRPNKSPSKQPGENLKQNNSFLSSGKKELYIVLFLHNTRVPFRAHRIGKFKAGCLGEC